MYVENATSDCSESIGLDTELGDLMNIGGDFTSVSDRGTRIRFKLKSETSLSRIDDVANSAADRGIQSWQVIG